MVRSFEENNGKTTRVSVLLKDYEYMGQVLTQFFKNALTVEAVGKQPASVKKEQSKEWTFHQTLAHVTAAAEMYLQALEVTLNKSDFVYPGMQRRVDLAALNDHEIGMRHHLSIQVLAQNLAKALERTAQLAYTLPPDLLTVPVSLPIFNRPLTVAEVLDMQIVHPGILHAAQLANPVGIRPLWTDYSPEFMHRQIARFFQVMSLIYWPERGGELRARLNFIIAGPGGGRWSVTIEPAGGTFCEHTVSRADVTMWIRNTQAFCQFFTNQESALSSLYKGKLVIWGDLRLAWKLAWLFSPT